MTDDEPPDSRIEVFVSDNGEPNYVRIGKKQLTPAKIFYEIMLYERGKSQIFQQQYESYKSSLEQITIQRQMTGPPLFCFIPSSHLTRPRKHLKHPPS